MPRFLIERTYTVDMDTLPEVATRSKSIGHHRFPEIVWEHSHVVVDDAGAIKTFCVYGAPDEEMIREHADAFGAHSITNVYELVDDVTPEEIRRRASAANL